LFNFVVTLPTQGNEVLNVVRSTLGPFNQVMDGQVPWASAKGIAATPSVSFKHSDAKPFKGFLIQP
jgi:hypothetical protein